MLWKALVAQIAFLEGGGRFGGAKTDVAVPAENQYTVDLGGLSNRIEMNARKSVTLKGEGDGGGAKTGLYCLPVAVHQNQCDELRTGGVANTINTNGNASGRNAPLVAVGYTPTSFGKYAEGVGTLKANGGDLGGGSETLVTNHAVRRLTPLECERLQGFPDGWTEYGIDPEKYRKSLGKGMRRTGLPEEVLLRKISDTQRYKALGNSVAIPCVEFIMRNIRGVMC